MNDADLVRVLLDFADRVEGFVALDAGVCRQVARRLAELSSETAAVEVERCASCGRALEQPPTGRRRRWCPASACQTASRRGGKTRENATLAS
jgi:hypothetical protein